MVTFVHDGFEIFLGIDPLDPDTDGDGLSDGGFGLSLKVLRGQLICEDGVGRMRRSRRFPKAGHGLDQVVLLGTSGYISLEAISWLDRLNIPLIHITADGRPVLSTTNVGLRNAKLRRAQSRALGTDIGFGIARDLLGRKIEGQLTVARRLGNAESVEGAASRLKDVKTLDELLRLEAVVAVEYWALWLDLPIRFVTKDQKVVPDHWMRFGTRSSTVSGRGPRLAANPANALLNYLYALLEAETVIACHAIGLDSQLGFFHTDTPGRDSLAADVMEAIRPDVDKWLLDLIGSHRFARKEFIDTPRGVCRLSTTLTHRLAETTTRWFSAVGPVVEAVAKTLLADTPTRLSQNNRRIAHGGPSMRQTTDEVRLDQTCMDCGDQPTATGHYCAECSERRKIEFVPELSERATAYLARARAEGRDPAHGGPAAKKRGMKNRQRQYEAQAWDRNNERPDPAIFTSEILPLLRDFTAGEMARATGLSRPYCSMIKRGDYVPHPRHWSTLRTLASDAEESCTPVPR